jgi:hypothetical protein
MSEPQPVDPDELASLRALMQQALRLQRPLVTLEAADVLAIVDRLQHLELKQELLLELQNGVTQASAKLETLISTLRETNAQGEAWLRSVK